MFCENCGLQFLPVQSVCTRCGATSTRHWFQLMSLVTLVVAATCNSLVACLLLPRLITAHAHPPRAMHAGLVVRAWLWTDLKASAYGWIPLGLGLLIWDYFLRQESQMLSEKIKGWLIRLVLIVGFVGGVIPLVPSWLRPPAAVLANGKLPHLPALTSIPEVSWILPWGMVGLAAALLCVNAETRDALLGRGHILSAASVVALVLVLMMTLLVFPV